MTDLAQVLADAREQAAVHDQQIAAHGWLTTADLAARWRVDPSRGRRASSCGCRSVRVGHSVRHSGCDMLRVAADAAECRAHRIFRRKTDSLGGLTLGAGTISERGRMPDERLGCAHDRIECYRVDTLQGMVRASWICRGCGASGMFDTPTGDRYPQEAGRREFVQGLGAALLERLRIDTETERQLVAHEAVERYRREQAARPAERTCRVYAIRNERTGAIKIGISTAPTKRLGSLQTATTDRLSLVATMHGDERAEQELHTRFAADRIGGEWFHPSAAVLAWVQEIAR